MPPWAPAGPPLLHGSRDNLNWSMCHCNLPIPPPQSLPTATLVFTNTAAHLRGKTLARAPSHSFACIQKRYSGHEPTFVGEHPRVKLFPSYFKVVNSIFLITTVNDKTDCGAVKLALSAGKMLRACQLAKQRCHTIIVVNCKLNAEVLCSFFYTSCIH